MSLINTIVVSAALATASLTIRYETVVSQFADIVETLEQTGVQDVHTPTETVQYVPSKIVFLDVEKPVFPSLKNINFSADEFVRYFDEMPLSNTIKLTDYPDITGDKNADEHIFSIAKNRGYQLRPIAQPTELVSYEGHYLQKPVIDAWKKLKVQAAASGHSLTIVSAYRSVAQQRSLFLQRLQNAAKESLGYTIGNTAIASGKADTLISQVLTGSSIPGTSKHHTGYALDIADTRSSNDFTHFAQTAAFTWLSENNYEHAKEFGFIPSYPDGATNMGPNPEAWEFVWVGDLGEMASL